MIYSISDRTIWVASKLVEASTPFQVALMSALNVGGYFVFLYALKFGEVFKVVTFMGFVTILTVIGGIFLLRETHNWKRKILAGLLATVGALLLG